MTPPEKMRRLNRDPDFRRAHREGQQRRWGLHRLTSEQLDTYLYLRRVKRLPRPEALEVVTR